MTLVQNNGGPNFYVGLSTEEKPTIADDHITEGAAVAQRDTKTIEVFSGNESDENNGWSTFIDFS